jgi:MFS family permease
MWLLGLPTFALALSITVVSAYLPRVAQTFTSSTTAIGAVAGGEGVMALWVPLLVGPWSDRLRTPLGGRLPFLIAATPVIALSLLLMGLAGSFAGIAAAAALFFLAYFVAYEPYRALYPDLLDSDEVAGRAQGSQAVWRGGGTFLALISGGALLSAGQLTPFVVGAIVVVAATGAFAWIVVRGGLQREQTQTDSGSVGSGVRRLRELVAGSAELRAYLIANALWELALAALKTFGILYMTEGLGYGLVSASLIVGATGALILGAAVAAGKLGDRLGRLVVLKRLLWVYGVAFAVPAFTTARPILIVAVSLVAIGGGAVMALAYAVLMPMMPEKHRGAVTGFYSVSRGLGITLGPVIAGALIAVSDSLFDSTRGYQAVWLLCCVAILASIPFTRVLKEG